MSEGPNEQPSSASGSAPEPKGPASPQAPSSAAPGKEPLDPRLVALCFILWLVAVALFVSNWDDIKRNYYWGNVRQGLEPGAFGGPHFDHESIHALAAMGEAVIPSCQSELERQRDPLFKIGVLKVLAGIPGERARALMEKTTLQDEFAQVRANGLLELRARTKEAPAEKPALEKIAAKIFSEDHDPDPEARNHVRATAALILAEQGDRRPEIVSHLVFALRPPFHYPEAAALLERVNPDGPKLDLEVKKGTEIADQIRAYEKWCHEHGVALVGSDLPPAKRAEPPK